MSKITVTKTPSANTSASTTATATATTSNVALARPEWTNLSPEQQTAFTKYARGENLFITGPGGTGKSTLIRYILADAHARDLTTQVCAMTGCAAVLLDCGARTVHSWGGLGLAKGDITDIISRVTRNYSARGAWKGIDLLIIDEVSMMSKKIFNLLDNIAKVIRRTRRPFGGIQIIFTGDFYQLPPVGDESDPDTSKFCFLSAQWANVFPIDNHIILKTNFRQTDLTYQRILNSIRKGELKNRDYKTLCALACREPDPTNLFKPTKLFPIKRKVAEINQIELGKLTGVKTEYPIQYHFGGINLVNTPGNSNTSVKILTKEQQKVELDKLVSNIPCDPTITLCVGAQVMCVVNLNVSGGICNGSQGIVVGFVDVPAGDFLNGTIKEKKKKIIHMLESTGGTNINVASGTLSVPIVEFHNKTRLVIAPYLWTSEIMPTIGISQLPLILAWAVTIHKSQGATMDMAEIDAGHNIFECGQTYVALSRVKSVEGLYLSAFDLNCIQVNETVREFYIRLEQHEQGLFVDLSAPYLEETELQCIPTKTKTTAELAVEANASAISATNLLNTVLSHNVKDMMASITDAIGAPVVAQPVPFIAMAEATIVADEDEYTNEYEGVML